jgi:hypothetical protein
MCARAHINSREIKREFHKNGINGSIRLECALGGYGLLADIEPARRRNDETALTEGPGFDVETKALNRRPKLPVKLPVPCLDVNPYDQNAGRGQEVHKPVQRGLKRLDRMLPPLDESNVISTTGKLAGRGGGDTRVAAAAQLKNPAWLLRACQDDSMITGAPGEFDHRIDDSIH